MSGWDATAGRVVTLRAERDGPDTRHLDARLTPSGDLRVDGQDLGPATEIVRPDGEYEWTWTVSAAQIPELLRVLGAEAGADILEELSARWSGPASYDLERRLRESGLARLAVW